MKRHLSILACLVLVVAMVFTLASCNIFNKPDPHTHNYVNGVCECGESDPDYVAPHTHNFVEGKCECGESDPDYVAPECEHDYSVEVTKAATCTEEGEKTFTCNLCGYNYVASIAPTGHTLVAVPSVKPTCTETGLSKGEKCDVCGTVTLAQNIINATGHSYADGACSVCGEADPNYNGPKTYVFDVQTLTAFSAGKKADGETEVVGDFFTIYYSAKTKIDTTKDKTWPDGYSFAEGLRLNWGGTTSVGETTKNAIEIVVDGTATVKVWWICGGDGREIGIFDANGDIVVASATNDSFTEGTEGTGAGKNGVYLSELALDAAGTYYIGTDNTNAIKNGGNIICKVEVTVTPAEESGLEGSGTQDSPFVLPSTGDYTCAYPGGSDLVYYAYTVPTDCYVTLSSTFEGTAWLKAGSDIYNLATNDGSGAAVKVLVFAGSTVYFGVADWNEQACDVPFNVSVEEVTFGSWDHLVGSWKGNIASFWTAVGYTITINADGTGIINENGGYYSVDYVISNIAVIGNTVTFTAADEYGNAPACYTFVYDAESNTLVADGGTLYVDDGSGTPVNPDVSYETVINEGSNTLYFSADEIAADAASRKLVIAFAGNYKLASGNLFVSSIVDANGNTIAKNEDYTYTLAEGEYTVNFSMLSMFGVIADNGCDLNVTIPEVVDPGTGDDDDDDEYPEFQFDPLKDAITGWYEFDGYGVGIYESYQIGTYLANVYGEGYDLYFTFDVTVNEDGTYALTLYHYSNDIENNPDMVETVLGYNIVIGGASDDEPVVDATDITTLPGTGASADPFVITESDNYFLTEVNSYPGYLVSFGGSSDITVTIKADLAELYSKSWATKYAEENTEYTFTLKAGETLTMWVVMETGTADKVVINVTIDGEGAGTDEPDVDEDQAAANATLNGTYAFQPEEGLAFIVKFENGTITVLRDDLGANLPESFAYNYSPMTGSITTEYGYFYTDVASGDLYFGRGWLLAPYVEGEDPAVPATPVIVVGDNTVSVTDTWNGTTVILSATEAVTYVIAPGANAVVVYDYSNYFEGDKLEIALEAGASVELIVLTENWEAGDVVVNVSVKEEVPGGDIPEGVESTDLTFTAPKAWAKTDEQSFIAGVAGDYTITATGYDVIVKTYLQYYDAATDTWTRIDADLPYTITLSAGQELKLRLYGWDNSDEGKEIVVHIFTTAGSEPAGCEHNSVSTDKVDATCTTDGSVTSTCDDCGEVVYSQVLTATGHSYNGYVCGVCGQVNDALKFVIAGSNGFFGSDWTLEDTNNLLVYADGIYTKTYESTVNGIYQFKIIDVTNGYNWDVQYPTSNYYFYVEVGSKVVISLDPATKAYSVKVYAPGSEDYTDGTSYMVVGDSALCGDVHNTENEGWGWETNNYANIMSLNAEGKYQLVYTGVAVGNYGIKVVKNGDYGIGEWGDNGSNYMINVADNNSIVTITFDVATGTITHTVHAHSYTSQVTTAATCNAAGVLTYTCSCGDSYTEEIAITGHVDDNGDFKCDSCSTTMLPADGEALTIPQAIAIAKLAGSSYTTQKYYITGIVTGLYNTQYGNFYLKDAEGNQICIYGLYSYDGSTRYDAMSYKPVNGDELTVYTVLGTYNSDAQGKNAWLDEVIAHEHNYSSQVTDPTCNAVGYTTHTCSICSDSYTDSEVEALGHTTDNGTCERCGLTFGGTEPVIGTLAEFTFGANGSATHKDPSSKFSNGKSYTVNGYTLKFTSATNCYDGGNDAKGNSCMKMGTSSNTGSFTVTVADDVTEVVIYVAQYKANATKISVNGGAAQTISTASNNGAYTAITIDTSVNKTFTFATVSGGVRCMIDTIVFNGIVG